MLNLYINFRPLQPWLYYGYVIQDFALWEVEKDTNFGFLAKYLAIFAGDLPRKIEVEDIKNIALSFYFQEYLGRQEKMMSSWITTMMQVMKNNK